MPDVSSGQNWLSSFFPALHVALRTPCFVTAIYKGLFTMSGGLSALAITEDDITKMLAATTHIGSDNSETTMEQYIFKKRTDGVNIINLKKTWEKLVLAARAIAAVENPQDVYVVASRPYAQRAVLKFARYVGCSSITESHLNLICKCSGCESSCDRAAADIPCKLKNSSLSVWSASNNIHILRVFNSCNCSCCQEKLLPSLLEVDDVHTIISFLEYILFHCCLAVLRPDMGGGSQHLSDVIFGNCQSIKSSRHFQITLLFFSYEKKRVLSATWRA